MNIQAKKLEIVRKVLDTDNPGLLDTINSLFQIQESGDYWDLLSKDQKEEILQGIKEAENGEVVEYSDLIAKFRR